MDRSGSNSQSESALPHDAKLQASKGFYLYLEQVSRLLRVATRHENEPTIPQVVLIEELGLSKYRIESLASLAAGMGLIRPVLYLPTDFGMLVHQHDPFFDDLGTLWLCHYLISSDLRYVVWNRMTNQILPQSFQPIGREVAAGFSDLRERFSGLSVTKHVPKEISVFFNAYTEQSFSRLYYLREVNDGLYTLTDAPVPVPSEVLLAILLIFRDRFQTGASGLEVRTICTADHSPGRLLHLGESQVRVLLDRLHEAGLLTIESRANLDQVRFRPEQTWLGTMQAYYEHRT